MLDARRAYVRRMQAEKKKEMPSEPTWGDALWGMTPASVNFWKSLTGEGWATLKGTPQLPIFAAQISNEILTAPAWVGMRGVPRVLALFDNYLNPKAVFDDNYRTQYAEALAAIDFENLDADMFPLLSAIKQEYKGKYGDLKTALATNPWSIYSDVLPALAKGAKLGKYGKHSNTILKVVEAVDPSNIVGTAAAAGLGAAAKMLPPPRQIPTLKEQYGTGKETELPVAEAAEKYAAGEKAAPMAVLSGSDEIAALESNLAHRERQTELNPYTDADTVKEVLQRVALSRKIGDEKIEAHLQELAEKAGIPYENLSAPTQIQRNVLDGIIEAWEQGDLQMRQNLADYISDLQGHVYSDYDVGVLVRDSVKKQYEAQSEHFREVFRKDEEILGKEINLDDFEVTNISETPGLNNILPNTYAKMMEIQERDSALLANPDYTKALSILESLFQADISDKNITLSDIDKLRTNFRKQLDIAMQQGEITEVGSKDVNKIFHQTLTEDLHNIVDRYIELSPENFPENFETAWRAHKAEYRAQKELQETPTARRLNRIANNPEKILPEVLKMNPEALADFEKIITPEGMQELQPSIFNYILAHSRNREGDIDAAKLKLNLDALEGVTEGHLIKMVGEENATQLKNVLTEVERVEAIPKLRETPAGKFVARNAHPRDLYNELTKKGGIFNDTEIENLKTIAGTQRWEEIKVGLTAYIYGQSTIGPNEKFKPGNLKKILDTMTDRDKDRLIQIFGETEAKELIEQGAFWQRFERLSGWNRNSNTKFYQGAEKWMSGKSAGRLMRNIAIYLQVRGLRGLESLNAIDYASMTLLVGSFAGPYGWRKFIASEAGRNYLLSGVQIGVPGTSLKVDPEDLSRMADFMMDNKIWIGHVTHQLQEAKTRAGERQEARRRTRDAERNQRHRFVPRRLRQLVH